MKVGLKDSIIFFMRNKIFNIGVSCSFADVLAERFLAEYEQNPLELAAVTFLLPSRRACQTLREAFVRAKGLEPTLLPQMLPIGSFEEGELLLSGIDALSNLGKPISKLERQLLFVRLILSKSSALGEVPAAQAVFLAEELAGLIDEVHLNNLSFENLKNLVPEEYATHWQETLRFLEIITKFYPAILKEQGQVDCGEWNAKMILALANNWKPKGRVVMAGVTATYPMMKELVKSVLKFENAELILSGLDKFLDDEDWREIDEQHPQFELKELLDFLNVSRFEVKEYVEADKNLSLLVSEVMRPAKSTDKWQDIAAKDIKLPKNLSFINCAEIREETAAIALIMRRVLETPSKTAALVTSDRNLARRVAKELERWEVKVDDSAGKPLSLSPLGVFLRQVIKACEDNFAPESFLALLKHPLCLAGFETADFRKKVRDYEKNICREKKENAELESFISEIKAKFASLYEQFSGTKTNLKKLIEAHLETAAKLADEKTVWRGENGEAAAKFFAELYQHADVLGEVEPGQYLSLIEALMAKAVVRKTFGQHPRLKILGPMEARLHSFDVSIIGEVNEGIWPAASKADPWMSGFMKKDFGLTQKNLGVMAQDFASLLCGPEVYVVRANRVCGTPMVKSRWLLRLETVLKALGADLKRMEDIAYKTWAVKLDEAKNFNRLPPPQPKPPLSSRPLKLSAGAVELLRSDPYAVFAKYILKLKPLEDLDQDWGAKEYGTLVHSILDAFNKKHPSGFPDNAVEEFLKIGEEFFKANKVVFSAKVFWWPKFVKTVDWLVEAEKRYRPMIKKVHSEIEGSMKIGSLEITAKADRVDETVDGKINIIDYKTGRAKAKKDVKAGYAPQLPIEGLIAQKGGFKGVEAADVQDLMYWSLGNEQCSFDEIEEILEYNEKALNTLFKMFYEEEAAYICRPNPKYVPGNEDYLHLARVKEWSVQGEADEE